MNDVCKSGNGGSKDSNRLIINEETKVIQELLEKLRAVQPSSENEARIATLKKLEKIAIGKDPDSFPSFSSEKIGNEARIALQGILEKIATREGFDYFSSNEEIRTVQEVFDTYMAAKQAAKDLFFKELEAAQVSLKQEWGGKMLKFHYAPQPLGIVKNLEFLFPTEFFSEPGIITGLHIKIDFEEGGPLEVPFCILILLKPMVEDVKK